jgi:hypothetical protein
MGRRSCPAHCRAARAGLSWTEPGGTAEAAEAEGFAADEATEAALAEIIAAAGEGTSMAMVQSYLRDGDIDARLIDRAASQAGVEPAAMAEKLEAAMSGMEAAMDARLESLGVHDHDLLAEWIGQSPERLDQMREAVLSLMTSNSTAGWDALAESYVQSLDTIDPAAVEEACEDAGIPAKRVGGRGSTFSRSATRAPEAAESPSIGSRSKGFDQSRRPSSRAP